MAAGETIGDLIERAGGYTENAYQFGAIYLNEDAKKQAKEDYTIFDDCSEAEVYYQENIASIMLNNCVSCHSSSSVNGDLSDYASIKQYIDSEELLDRVQRDENEAGFMPLGSSRLNQQQIDLLIKWKNNGAPNN